jgi:hypothetical protein
MQKNQYMKLKMMKKLPTNFVNKTNIITIKEIEDKVIEQKNKYIDQIEIFKFELNNSLCIFNNTNIINTDEDINIITQ